MPQQLIIGTYTESLAHVDGQADGILIADYTDGRLGPAKLAAEARNPSWLSLDPSGRELYCVLETTDYDPTSGGGVAAFRRDPATGSLTFINAKPSHGTEPAHLALDPSGRYLVVSNYRDGAVAVFALDENGGIGDTTDVVRPTGSSVHPIRQTNPHAHQIVFDPITGD